MSAIVAFLGLRGTVVAGILGALTLAAGGFGGYQYLRAEAAVIAKDKAVNARDASENSLATCIAANESAAFAEQARKAMAEANTRVYMAALDNAREAAEKARRDKAYVDGLLAEWRKTWGDKTPTCAAALQTLDNACPELRTY